ncbi:MBL fold metallo-hydrolase [Bergeyella sp. RCAD1439]|uniref:MBL fold metallo-hydrolase n=1 Tax=Bergeyella anatis TaxID=3113737 RepID=UPI002E19F17C|nr:MBL fold metallo-hydrolase [Bergeyella sp. RCAD1439]
MKLKFLGTGTSQGVPVIGCDCEVCRSEDVRDQRMRASVMFTTDEGKKILVDCGPDFRRQMLDFGESHVDALLLTHEHNDHVIGLDDLRPIIFKTGQNIAVYGKARVCEEVRRRFPYAFAEERYPGAPAFDLFALENQAVEIAGTMVLPIEVRHYQMEIYGYRFGAAAYVTDASFISQEEKEKLKNLDILVLNCIRKEKPHPAHFILPEVLALNDELKPKKMYLTHISHHFGRYLEEENRLPSNVHQAYDGLELFF